MFDKRVWFALIEIKVKAPSASMAWLILVASVPPWAEVHHIEAYEQLFGLAALQRA